MRRLATLGLYGLVLAGLVGGTLAWMRTDRPVTLSIDGRTRTLHSVSRTVAGTLHDAAVTVGPHDALAPSPGTVLHGGAHIVLLRGRLLHLDVDGRRTDVWTTAGTVSQALAQLGYGGGALTGVSRSTRLPLSPTAIGLITPKHVTVTADGRTRTVITTAGTVAALLSSLHLSPGANDRLSVPGTARPVDDERIVLQRVRFTTTVRTTSVPYGTRTTPDPTAYRGTTVVVVPGRDGVRQQTVQFIFIDGRPAGTRIVADRVTVAPVTRQQRTGTRAGPPPAGAAQAIARSMVTARGWDDGQFGCLVDLWDRESGWRTNAYNPSGAYGIPQALPGSKMASAGSDWETNPATQITWGLNYIAARYTDPCGAWANEQSQGSY